MTGWFKGFLNKSNIADYKKRMFGLIEDEYRNIFSEASRTPCPQDKVPNFDRVHAKLQEFFNQWLQHLLGEVIRTCRQKLDTYNRYQITFAQNKNDYRGKIIAQCIEKNERYIRDLTSVLEQEKRNAINN